MPELTSPFGTGRHFGNEEIDLIRDMVKYGMLMWTEDPFRLKSGVPSHIYFNGRGDLTDNPALTEQCGRFIGKRICDLLSSDEKRRPIVIGIPTAATGFAACVTHYNPRVFGRERPGFRIMREKLKQNHGATGQRGYWVNGRPDQERHIYFTIENVVTSGGSLLEALERLESNDSYDVKAMTHFVFMDRQQGGVARLRREGYTIHSFFELLDVVWVLSQLDIKGWDGDRLAKVKAEIDAHQVV
ncbi:MAG: hypothetical protein RLZZ70_833 [Candidatus Parcubacteria bacterium]